MAMDLVNDERVKHLTEQIQHEKDPDKVLQLTRELCRILDGGKPPESEGEARTSSAYDHTSKRKRRGASDLGA